MKRAIIVIICAIVVGVGGGLLFDNLQKKKIESPHSQTQEVEKKLPSETTKQYKDKSGFAFEYPDDISASASSSLDNSTYTDIVLTSKTVSGDLKLKVSDTKLKIMNDWLLQQNATKSGTVENVTLGDFSAKEINIKKSIKTGVIDQGILFEITVNGEKEIEYWKKAYGIILQTFSFVNPQPQQSGTVQNSNESDVVDEGEEVVE